jgi:hypothetical protein
MKLNFVVSAMCIKHACYFYPKLRTFFCIKLLFSLRQNITTPVLVRLTGYSIVTQYADRERICRMVTGGIN